MSKCLPIRLATLSLVAAVLAIAADAAEPGADAAHLQTYTAADGVNYFALSLKPDANLPAAEGHDVVVLLDTSASQTGPFRTEGLAVLKAALDSLSPNVACGWSPSTSTPCP